MVFLLNYPETLLAKLNFLKNNYSELYRPLLLPLLHKDDDLICVYKGKYLWIHLASPGWEKRGEYSTPEEVWENKIKKDIEEYLGL